MARVIYKFRAMLDATIQVFKLPASATVIHVHERDNSITFWVDGYFEEELLERRFVVFATGQPMPPGMTLVYRGTCHFESRGTVWHLYEVM